VSDVAHCPQKANPGGLAKPHCGQRRPTGLAHCPQNFVPSGFSKPQLGQRISVPSSPDVRGAGVCEQTFQCAPLTCVYGMVCQYSRCGPVSSEKHETAAEAGAEERGGGAVRVVPVPVVAGVYRAMLESLKAMTRRAKSAIAWRFMTCGRLYLYDTLLEGLPQDLQDVAAELRQFIQEEHSVVRERDLARHRDLTPADQPHV
jgi:hypothetical protein